jgi:hypothetical protein
VHLTIKHSTTSAINPFVCDSYTSPSGKVWTDSGEYMDTIPNTAGCDSIIIVHLTIKNSIASTYPTACDSYTSPSGKVWTISGEYIDTIPNAAGCDSIISVHLTIKNSTTSTISSIACDSYTSPGGNVWTYSGEYNDTIPNSSGCDSLITVYLTIISADTSVTQNQEVLTANAIGAAYQWIDCDNCNTPIEGEIQQTFTANKDGNYSVIVTQYGCTDTSACFSVNPTGLIVNTFEQNIILYPNPNDGSFTIDLGNVYSNTVVTITAPDGRIIHRVERDDARVIDLNMIAPQGIYLVTITSAKERAVFKILRN